jgi:hypothetical protein
MQVSVASRCVHIASLDGHLAAGSGCLTVVASPSLPCGCWKTIYKLVRPHLFV